ncbi:MAG TPA: hypothetical protein VMG82_36610 [Candidatus Sulfotelmatobacter sp.]|nr:hypothetical protein [Candidatus Sulfotelmatobacter sp.]
MSERSSVSLKSVGPSLFNLTTKAIKVREYYRFGHTCISQFVSDVVHVLLRHRDLAQASTVPVH